MTKKKSHDQKVLMEEVLPGDVPGSARLNRVMGQKGK
jgi:hypothetical protein